MHRLRKIIQSTVIGLIVSLQIATYPAVALAETTATTDSTVAAPVDPPPSTESTTVTPPNTGADTTQPPSTVKTTGPITSPGPSSPTGTTQPTGPAASTFNQNSDGTWGNDLYIWDPATGQTRPKTPQTYSYNPLTKMWDTTEWYFSPEAGKYLPNIVSVPQNPLVSKTASLNSPSNGALISQTGPSSNNNILLGGNTTDTFNMFFDARISNAIGQMSRSGNAGVQGNTLGGSALTGDAQSIANLLNLLQSSWGTLGSDNISTFVSNIDGNVVGDLYIDPALIPAGSGNTKLDVNIAKNGQINNDVNLSAQSGNAKVGGNTVGGNAQSGSANSVANLLNLINSAITAKKSFVGVLNINGDLEGDILLPPGLLQSIIASSGPSSNNTIKESGNTTLNVGVDTNRSILNKVTTDASSGNALVGNNTSGGTATTGNANNNVTLLNLTGHRVVAKNAMLVFVNVFGKWVGLIMNAPAGSTAVAATGPNSNNTIDAQHNTDVNIRATENSQINNNIHTAAHSGDAEVSGNTMGGNAGSGNASAGANILNMIDSTFDISDWFGVLFINVFGTWHGSFGVDTPYGNPTSAAAAGGSGGGSSSLAAAAGTTANSGSGGVFRFVPLSNSVAAAYNQSSHNQQVAGANAAGGESSGPSSVAAAATAKQPSKGTNSLTSAALLHPNWTLTIAGISTALSLMGLERYLTFRRRIV